MKKRDLNRGFSEFSHRRAIRRYSFYGYTGGNGGDSRHYRPQYPRGFMCAEQGACRTEHPTGWQAGGRTAAKGRRKQAGQ